MSDIDDIKDIVFALSMAFGGNQKSEQIDFYSNILDEKGFKIEAISTACKRAAGIYNKFPSLNEILSLIKEGIPLEKEARIDHFLKKESEELKKESDVFERLKEKYILEKGIEAVMNYAKKWFRCVYGEETFESLSEYGLTFSMWLKPAIFDLEEAKGDYTAAVNIGREKNKCC